MPVYYKGRDGEIVHKKERTGSPVTESSTEIESSEVKRQTDCAWTQESFHFSAEIYSLRRGKNMSWRT